MDDRRKERLHAFFDRLFPHGFAGADLLAEIAPDGWERSPLYAYFHPSVEQRYEEAVQLHRTIEKLRTRVFAATTTPRTPRAFRRYRRWNRSRQNRYRRT